MAERTFHPKAVLYSIYAILFLSNLYVAAIILPLLTVPISEEISINLIALFIPLLAGFMVSELLSDFKLFKTGIIGSTLLSVSSALGIISNKTIISALIWLSEKFSQTYSRQETSGAESFSGILVNIDTVGAEIPLIFGIGFLGFNIPILYRCLKDGSVDAKYMIGYIIPVAVFSILYLILKSLNLFS